MSTAWDRSAGPVVGQPLSDGDLTVPPPPPLDFVAT
jgi:hypothetical protein